MIDSALEAICLKAREHGGRLGRRLYLYFAGHGFSPDIDEAALLMANAARWSTGHHIPGRRYANWFRAAAFFDEVVLFMDCCREIYGSAHIHFPPWEDQLNPAGADTRFCYAFATEWSRAARERLSHGVWRGVFSEALIQALRHARDEEGRVTAASIEKFIGRWIVENSPPGQLQEPRFESRHPHQIVFAEGSVAPVTLRIHAAAGAVSVFDGALNRVQLTRADPPEAVLTRRGIYQIVSGTTPRFVEVSAIDGRTIDVRL